MVSNLFFYQLALLALLGLCLLLHGAWPSDRATTSPTPPQPTPPPRKRRREPKPFAGLTHKPHCTTEAMEGDLLAESAFDPGPLVCTKRTVFGV
jgi:hypothetical protein